MTSCHTIKTLRVTRVNSRDPQGQFWVTAALGTSATVFLLKPKRNELLGRADYRDVATKVQVVVVHDGIKNTCDSATNGQQ